MTLMQAPKHDSIPVLTPWQFVHSASKLTPVEPRAIPALEQSLIEQLNLDGCVNAETLGIAFRCSNARFDGNFVLMLADSQPNRSPRVDFAKSLESRSMKDFENSQDADQFLSLLTQK
jgi:hypothetical protein